jgi:drug/metabolite transporter (DMT)-like permease
VTLQEFALFIVSLIAGLSGQFFLKSGAAKLGVLSSSNFLSHVLRIATIPELIFGLTCYAMAAVLYILLLTRVNLSVLAPAVALQYVFTVIMGHFWFHETLPLSRITGVALIITGVVLLVAKGR